MTIIADNQEASPYLARLTGAGLILISAGTLTFEINLTRLFSVAQFYHFAFMVVSIALLGFGASGTVLTVLPHINAYRANKLLPWLGLGCSASMLGSYLLTNWLPFDSFSLAWDMSQVAVLVLHYIALAAPFFFSGMVVGVLLAKHPEQAGRTYALNLSGSAFGCLIALASPHFFGGEGTVSLSCAITTLSSIAWIVPNQRSDSGIKTNQQIGRGGKQLDGKFFLPIQFILSLSLIVYSGSDLVSRITGGNGLAAMTLMISPYKSVSYALQYPSAKLINQEWNSYSRVDVVRSAGIRSLPGLSYRYLSPPPRQDGLLVDGDDLTPILLEGASLEFAGHMPAALAYELLPEANVLILEPRGGLDILIALANGASVVRAVEPNSLIVKAASHIYNSPHVKVEIETGRSYLNRTKEMYDVIQISLVSAYHPIRSGAYSLAEDFRYTEEAIADALEHLKPNGLLIVTRWLQNPPSEFLRVFGLGISALNQSGYPAEGALVALRGYNIGTLFLKKGRFSEYELLTVRNFARERAFDLVYAPGLSADEANKFNILVDDAYYDTFKATLETNPREDFYRQYPFEVKPPDDNQPFFGHFFKWSQVRQVLSEFGKSWQPFGGAGYLVILGLLVLATLLAGIIIILPVFFKANNKKSNKIDLQGAVMLTYFGLIGLAFLLVEMPLIQLFILFLGQPAYSFTTVLFSLLLFSGLGSQSSSKIKTQHTLIILILLTLATPWAATIIFQGTLGKSLPLRIILSVVFLAPAGFTMGTAFPAGVRLLADSRKAHLVPWAWGVNGAASVVAAVLAALLAISFGFGWVLRLGAICYTGALVAFTVGSRIYPLRRPLQ